MPLTLVAHFYHVQALSTLGFVAQLAGAPSDMMRREEEIIASLLRVPYRALPWQALFGMGAVGGPELRSAEALARAVHFLYT